MSIRTFTRAELAQYNGKNGMPAFVAVNGTVYDLSTVFINGEHLAHQAGQELTGAFDRQHVPSILSNYPVVGKLAD